MANDQANLPEAVYVEGCWKCDTERHICPGCGDTTDHATPVCAECVQTYSDESRTDG